jgi:hypothetical protein
MARPNSDQSIQRTEPDHSRDEGKQTDETEPRLRPDEDERQEPNPQDDSNSAINGTFIEIHDRSP